MQLEFYIKSHGNPSTGSRDVSTRMDRQTYMTRLIVAFRNFSIVHEKHNLPAYNFDLATRMAGIKPKSSYLGTFWVMTQCKTGIYLPPSFGQAASSTCIVVKMDAVGSFQTYVTIYQSTLRHIQQISIVACSWLILLIARYMRSNRVAGLGGKRRTGECCGLVESRRP